MLGIGPDLKLENGQVAALKAGGEPDFRRPSSGDPAARDSVRDFTCGGQHLLQTVIACQEWGFLPNATRPRVEARLAALQRRLVGESNFRQAEKKKATAAGVDVTLVEHQSALALLKLNGHALETFGARATRASAMPWRSWPAPRARRIAWSNRNWPSRCACRWPLPGQYPHEERRQLATLAGRRLPRAAWLRLLEGTGAAGVARANGSAGVGETRPAGEAPFRSARE